MGPDLERPARVTQAFSLTQMISMVVGQHEPTDVLDPEAETFECCIESDSRGFVIEPAVDQRQRIRID